MWSAPIQRFSRSGKLFLTCVFFILLAGLANAQDVITVRGRVTTADGNALGGVSVLIKGKAQGTSTNDSGAFTIRVPREGVLNFSRVGFDNKEVNVNNQSTLDLSLDFTTNNMDQVVVVAYGAQKKATVTGAISTITTKELKQSPAANLAASLAGRLPGLTAIQTSSEPGKDNVSLYLRGVGTVNGQTPVILVDGVPRDITYIDPNEIESVTILKDASSTAVFGVRGANGVILVTTKRGKQDRPEINFSVENGEQAFTRLPTTVNSFQYATLKNQEDINAGNTPEFSQTVLDHFRLQDQPTVYANNNWEKLLMHKYVSQQRYNLNLSGGTEYVKYFINAGYLNQGGQWKTDQTAYDPRSWLHRYNFRSNIDVYLNHDKTLKTFLNLGGYVENVNSPAGSNAGLGFGNAINELVDIFGTPPSTPGPLNGDGQIVVYKNINSPYADINRSGYVQENRNNILASFGMEQDLKFITRGLSTKVMISFDTKAIHDLIETQSYAKVNQAFTTGSNGQDSSYYLPYNADINGTLQPSVSTTFQTYSNFQWYINYARTFGKHAFTGLLLAQQDKTIKPQETDNPSNTDFPLPFNLRGFSGRFTYGYDGKYFAEFNAGYNGSEQFAPTNRYGFFPAFSAGWLISEEKFMRGIKALSVLKIRGSYGLVGNDKIGNLRFLYRDNTTVTGGGYIGGGSSLGTNGQTVNETYIGNPNLKWETSKKADIGLEVGLFSELTFIADFYRSKNNSMLIARGTVPLLNGLPTGPSGAIPPQNIGRLTNEGYELELDYNKSLNKDLAILAKLNFNYSTNKINFLDEAEKTADYAYRYNSTGYAVGQFFGLISQGFWASQAEINASGLTYQGVAPRPGDLKYKDLNKDGIIDSKDLAPIGHPNVPAYTFGATFGTNYKGWDISLLFQGVSGASADYRGWGIWENYGAGGYFSQRHLSSWTPGNVAKGVKILYPELSTSQSASQTFMSDYWLENTSYIRLKNAEIGYTIPGSWSSKIGAKRVRLYANGFNLITWDNMINKGFDPEVGNNLTYPIYKTFNFGANIVF